MAVFNLRGWMFVQLGPFFSPYNYFCIKSRLSRFLSPRSYKPHSCLIDSTITTASPTVSPQRCHEFSDHLDKRQAKIIGPIVYVYDIKMTIQAVYIMGLKTQGF